MSKFHNLTYRHGVCSIDFRFAFDCTLCGCVLFT